MKKAVISCLFSLTTVFTFAQKTVITGSVNDQQGKPVAYAFIKDARHNYATFSDPNGAFVLRTEAVDHLIVSAGGFNVVTIKVSESQNVDVVLANNGSATNITIDPDAFKEHISSEGMTRNVASGYIAKEASVHGSRYFFDNWVRGYAITSADSIKENDNYRYNYHKVDGNLLFTDDGKTMKTINRELIKAFVLFDNEGIAYTFENVPAIDTKHYTQVLTSGSKYKIYKQLGTKFFPNDYVTNGMTSRGNNYDEIKDEPVYYVAKMPGGQPEKFALRNKDLKKAFSADAAKVSKYLSDHDRDIDEKYLIALGEYLNN
jgi:hypothetical protein